jgi:hypothetical protein
MDVEAVHEALPLHFFEYEKVTFTLLDPIRR